MDKEGSLLYRNQIVAKPIKSKRHIGFLILWGFYMVMVTGIHQSVEGVFLSRQHINNSISAILFYFIGLLAVFGGVLTAFPFPMEKTDRVSGWNQYLFALPVTAKDYALSKIWLILSQSVLYLGCVLLYTAYAWFHLDVLILIYMLNMYFLGVLVCICVEALAYLVRGWRFWKKHKNIAQIAYVLLAVVTIWFFSFGAMSIFVEESFVEIIYRFTTFRTLLLFFVLLPAGFGLYYYALVRVYKARTL